MCLQKVKTVYSAAEVGPLIGIDQIEDPRYQPFVHFSLPEIIFLVISASLSRCDTLVEMVWFGQEKIEWLRRYFPYQNGIPSHDTISRLLGAIDRHAFENWFRTWVVANFILSEDELIALDGKRLSGSADKANQSKRRDDGGVFAKMVVNVFASKTGIVLAQQDVSTKSDEVDGARQLLKSLTIKGSCISGDANFCSRDLLDLILGGEADYMLTLKGKSPILHKAVKAAFADEQTIKQEYQTEDKGHGRLETRLYRCLPVTMVDEKATKSYSGLQQLIEVQRQRRVIKDKEKEVKTTFHYYITSKTDDVVVLADIVRRHWAIENNLHWVLDVNYGEDDSRARKGNLAVNFSLIRKFSLNLTQRLSGKGVREKRTRSILSDEYRSAAFINPMR